MSTVVTELIKTIINVKTPVALFAFVSVVLLIAFRTKAVPELFFGVVKEKLTRERFAQLLHRFLTYGFVAFLALCAIAVIGQMLDTYSSTKSGSVDAIKAELEKLHVSNEQRDQARQAYEKALTLIDTEKFNDAVTALQASIAEVPTITARMTLAHLLDRLERPTDAKAIADQAANTAHDRGTSLDVVRADLLSMSLSKRIDPAVAPASVHISPLVTTTTPLPPAGDSFVTAKPILPGDYLGKTSTASVWTRVYYRIDLAKKRKVVVTYVLPDGGASDTYVRMYDFQRGFAIQQHSWTDSAKGTLEWQFNKGDYAYISLAGGIAGTAYQIELQ